MAENKDTTNTEAYAQFEEWLRVQPSWLQDAAWRIYHGLKIDDDQISIYADMCVAQAKKESFEYKRLSDKETAKAGNSSKMAIMKLSDIVGVNALAAEASINFSEKALTVIYGLNGAGKSGFMRIFKQLSGSPFEEPIQPNVFKKTEAGKPSCKFLVKVNGAEQEVPCDLSSKTSNQLFSGFDVFDTRISNAYITSTNNVCYQPFVFTVLSQLSNTADRITKRLKVSISGITNESVKVPDEFSRLVETSWIRDLSEKTKFPETYAVWPEELEKLLSSLPALLDTEKVTQRLGILQGHLRTISPIFDDLEGARIASKSESLAEAYKEYLAAKSKLDVAKKMFKESADEKDQISVNSADWKSLWAIAKSYYETSFCEENGKQFGDQGSICPLCHQSIAGATFHRFKSVNEYINGTCSEDYNTALKTLKNSIEPVLARVYSPKQIVQQLSQILNGPEIRSIAAEYEKLALVKAEADVDTAFTNICSLDLAQVIAILSDKKSTFETEIDDLKKSLQDEEQIGRQKQLTDLKCHKWIFQNKASLETVISNLKRIKQLSDAKQYLTTNKITIESNRLASALITDAYIGRFTNELQRLAPGIKVKLEKASSQKGNSPYKVTLDSGSVIKHKPEDILSEGEQRIVALAAFFADATGRDELTPLIIDDPISSLDNNFEERATKRIVELARTRQVIVFTHRISLLIGIKDCCEEQDVDFCENRIRSAFKGKGLLDLEGKYYGKIPEQLNDLSGRLKQVKKKDPDSEEYVDAIGRSCQQFRICVERSVEDELLFGIVKRFSRKIRTDNLVKKLPAITHEDCKMVDDMMTKYSFIEHSQPSETPSEYYAIEDIQTDVQKYYDWLTEYKKRTLIKKEKRGGSK